MQSNNVLKKKETQHKLNLIEISLRTSFNNVYRVI